MLGTLKPIRLLAKRLARHSYFKRPIKKSWNTYEHLSFSYNGWNNLKASDHLADIETLRLFYVPPQYIKTSDSSFDFIIDTGKVTDGPWDQNQTTISAQSVNYSWFREHFHEGVPWNETARYDTYIQRIKNGHKKRYVTVNEFETKLDSYDKMYREFKQGNYLTQSELAKRREDGLPGDGGRALFPSLTDHTLMRHEIAVNIGRNGTLLRNDGRHRLCLALLAEVEEIPVRVVVRHTEWQNLRDSIARAIDNALDAGMAVETVQNYVQNTLAEELDGVHNGLDHPDLDIIFERRLPTN